MTRLLLPEDFYAALQRRGFGLGDIPDAQTVATTPDEDAAWAQFLGTSADQLQLVNATALSWYDSMRDQFKAYEVPLLQVAAYSNGMPTTWTQELDQQLLDLSTMADYVAGWLREAAAGQRQMVIQGDTWGLASKPTDDIHIVLDTTQTPPVPVMMQGPAGTNVVHEGPNGLGAGPLVIGGVAIPWVIAGIALVGIIAVVSGVLYVIYIALRGMIDTIQGVQRAQNDKQWISCLENAKSPEDKQACVDAINALTKYTGAINAGKPSLGDDASKVADALSKGAQALLWVGLAGGAAYLAIEYGPELVAWVKQKLESRTKEREQLAPG